MLSTLPPQTDSTNLLPNLNPTKDFNFTTSQISPEKSNDFVYRGPLIVLTPFSKMNFQNIPKPNQTLLDIQETSEELNQTEEINDTQKSKKKGKQKVKKVEEKGKGPWTPEEDELLRNAVTSSSPIVWDLIAERVPGRNAIQCRDRWKYRLDPDLKKKIFEDWEDDLIIEERRKIGNKWTLIANKLPGRTDYAVKNRWYTYLRYHEHLSPEERSYLRKTRTKYVRQ